MDKFANQFFSMRMMAVAMFVFFVAIGGATLLESTYDTQTAKLYIYNAMWFNLLLTYLSLNLIANIMRHRMIQTKKWAVLLFHVSFIVILIGAGVTRFVSFEGMMRIAEGDTSNFIYSSNPHIAYRINDKNQQLLNDYPVFLSELDTWNDFELTEKFPGVEGEITFEYVDFHKNMVDSIVTNDSIKESAIELIHLGKSRFISQNGFLDLDNVLFSFDKKNAMPGVEFIKKDNGIQMKVMLPGATSLPMSLLKASDRTKEISDSLYRPIPMDTLVPLETSTLYKVGQAQFVYKGLKKHTKSMRIKSPIKNEGLDDLIVKVSHQNESKIITVTGGISSIPSPVFFELNGLFYDIAYGPKIIEIPFSVGCSDFRLDRYPGSNAASSYESDLEIIDSVNNHFHKQTVFMNNVMDYRGYRFFQSAYFPNEKGTMLSVNHDAIGTTITYIGYLLMALGMVISIFMKNGRMRELVRKLIKSGERRAKLYEPLLVLMLFSMTAFGQTAPPVEVETIVEDHTGHNHDHEGHDHTVVDSMSIDQEPPIVETTTPKQKSAPVQRDIEELKKLNRFISEEASDEMATMLIQDFRGRIIPYHTYCDQIMRKVHRGSTYEGKNPVQVVTAMTLFYFYWAEKDVIYVSSKGGLRDKLNGKTYVSLMDLTNSENGEFLFTAEAEKAHQKKESERDEFDKQVLKLVEKYSIMRDVQVGRQLLIIPSISDPNHVWKTPMSENTNDQTGPQLAFNMFNLIANMDGKSTEAKTIEAIKQLKEYQRATDGEICPSIEDIEMEVRYNKMNIFHHVTNVYGLVGFLLLIVFFIGIFVRPTDKSKKRMRIISLALIGMLGVTFLFHAYGVYMRAIITGYAPWSNGYEAMVFIGLVTMFLGFFTYKRYPVVTAGAAILAFLILFVSEMNLLDPEITPMQPVLKSYWLMIHVAIITGSYAPLGISCILSFLAMILYTVRNKKNGTLMNININELTYISEIFMTIGVFMLTIGTFLGGIWANESWGRYWGWDPKETWALVAVLVYAIILHFRYIPGLKGKFIFNVFAFWGYSAILFTFFGVNFFLVGLHSYAQGDGLGEIPGWIKATIWVFVAFTVFVAYRNRSFKQKMKQNESEIEG